MEGKLFQKYTHLLYCSVLSLGGNVNTRWMSKSDMGSIFHIKEIIGNYYVNYQNYQNLMLLTSFGYLTNTDASILIYKFRPKRTGFVVYDYAEYTQPQLTFLALHP